MCASLAHSKSIQDPLCCKMHSIFSQHKNAHDHFPPKPQPTLILLLPNRYNSSHYLRHRRIYYIIGSAVKFPYMILIHRHLVDVYKQRYYMVLYAMQV
jgi:hypothetical protein